MAENSGQDQPSVLRTCFAGFRFPAMKLLGYCHGVGFTDAFGTNDRSSSINGRKCRNSRDSSEDLSLESLHFQPASLALAFGQPAAAGDTALAPGGAKRSLGFTEAWRACEAGDIETGVPMPPAPQARARLYLRQNPRLRCAPPGAIAVSPALQASLETCRARGLPRARR